MNVSSERMQGRSAVMASCLRGRACDRRERRDRDEGSAERAAEVPAGGADYGVQYASIASVAARISVVAASRPVMSPAMAFSPSAANASMLVVHESRSVTNSSGPSTPRMFSATFWTSSRAACAASGAVSYTHLTLPTKRIV